MVVGVGVETVGVGLSSRFLGVIIGVGVEAAEVEVEEVEVAARALVELEFDLVELEFYSVEIAGEVELEVEVVRVLSYVGGLNAGTADNVFVCRCELTGKSQGWRSRPIWRLHAWADPNQGRPIKHHLFWSRIRGRPRPFLFVAGRLFPENRSRHKQNLG